MRTKIGDCLRKIGAFLNTAMFFAMFGVLIYVTERSSSGQKIGTWEAVLCGSPIVLMAIGLAFTGWTRKQPAPHPQDTL